MVHFTLQVWSGRVTWTTPDGRLSGSFAACGHLYPPTACAAATVGSSSSSYWSRYRLLPPVLQFAVDVQARGFETGPWQQPPQGLAAAAAAASPAAAASAPLCAGWDCCPLVLVPGGADDVAGLAQLMRLLRNNKGELVSCCLCVSVVSGL
jgi:hypothetical protein